MHLLGAGQRLGRRISDLYREAARQKKNVIAFDYSNVGYSKGAKISNFMRLVADGAAIISMLLEQGVPADQITLHGHSLGGFTATHLAAFYHQAGYEVNIYTASAPMELTGCVFNIAADKIPFGHGLLKSMINYLLTYFDWESDGIAAWDSIPEANKEYSLIDIETQADQISDNMIPLDVTISGKHQFSFNFDVINEEDSKLRAIKKLLKNNEFSELQRERLNAYSRIITSQPGTTFVSLRGIK